MIQGEIMETFSLTYNTMIENKANFFDYLSKVQNKVFITSPKYKYKKQYTKYKKQIWNTKYE